MITFIRWSVNGINGVNFINHSDINPNMIKMIRFKFLLAPKGQILRNIYQAPTTISISIFSNWLMESI